MQYRTLLAERWRGVALRSVKSNFIFTPVRSVKILNDEKHEVSVFEKNNLIRVKCHLH